MQQDLSSAALETIGFRPIGEWFVSDGKAAYRLLDESHADIELDRRNALYAFVVGTEIMYIGKTTRSIPVRMNNYRRPGPSQSTNIRCNSLIRQNAAAGRSTTIFGFTPQDHLRYGAFEIDLAAGLEDALIAAFRPAWNGRVGGRPITEEAEREIDEATLVGGHRLHPFGFRLVETYFDKGFFNIPIADSSKLGAHGEGLQIFLGDEPDPVDTIIDRKANGTGAVRTQAKARIRDWLQATFTKGAVVQGLITDPNSLRLIVPPESLRHREPDIRIPPTDYE